MFLSQCWKYELVTDTVKDGVMVIEAKKIRLEYSLTPYTKQTPNKISTCQDGVYESVDEDSQDT